MVMEEFWNVMKILLIVCSGVVIATVLLKVSEKWWLYDKGMRKGERK